MPQNAEAPEVRIPADIIVAAVGQGIETMAFEHAGIPIHRGTIEALHSRSSRSAGTGSSPP